MMHPQCQYHSPRYPPRRSIVETSAARRIGVYVVGLFVFQVDVVVVAVMAVMAEIE
jgi:hypothetical protein